MRAAVASAVAQRRPDLVHVDTIGLWPYAEVPRRAGLPTVLSHHNVESDLARRRAGRENASWRASILRRDADKLYALERSAAPLATVNTVVSRLDRERLETIAPGAAVEVVDNGVDVNYAHPEFLSTPLVACLLAGQEAIALYLLEHGANPHLHSEFDGMVPLQAARQAGLEKAESRLMALGATAPAPQRTPAPGRWLARWLGV